MRRESRRTQMLSLVETYQSSGEYCKKFCEKHHVAYSTFRWWLSKYRYQSESKVKTPPAFIQLNPPQQSTVISSAYYRFYFSEGFELAVPVTTPPATLIEILQQLRGGRC